MHTNSAGNRNPVQKSFAAGINRPQVMPRVRKDRVVKHREREFEWDG